MQKEQIISYYDTCETDYRLLWDLDYSGAMHAGYWDHTTHSLREALKRENEVLAEIAHITKDDKVLDAGCGIGGSAIFLAQTYQCQVTGITLNAKQVKTAQQKAKQANVQSLTTFEVKDYTCTLFSSQSFSVIWGLESICHTQDKSLFIQEAFRLLKPGRRLIIADGFATPSSYSIKDQMQMQNWLKGWGVESLDQKEKFENALNEVGFKNINFYDITSHVIPSSQRLYWISYLALPFSKLGEWIGKRTASQTANLYSARWQYQTLKKNLWRYGIFYAEK